MSWPCVQVVHVRLKVLDDAALVCRREVGTRVCKLEGTDGGIMGLQDGLKVEGQTVPQRELAARRAGQNAPSLGCPLENKDGRSGVYDVNDNSERTVTTLTGQRILFVEVWMNLVHSDVDALPGYAMGGRS